MEGRSNRRGVLYSNSGEIEEVVRGEIEVMISEIKEVMKGEIKEVVTGKILEMVRDERSIEEVVVVMKTRR